MKKILPIIIIVIVALGIGGLALFGKKKDPNAEPKEQVETPPVVTKVNTLPLAAQPYIALLPHENKNSAIGCNGVDLVIENLKNNEQNAEYELEYNTQLIQGVMGTRDFTQKQTDFKPLEFGTCSKGRCKCDTGITGGSLKLSFKATQEYILKQDFAYGIAGENNGVLSSRDGRVTLSFGDSLPKTAVVIIMKSFGLPKELDKKIIVGPWGVYSQNVSTLKNPLITTIQSQDVANSQIMLYDGIEWKKLEGTVEGDKVSFELPALGMIALTEK